MAAATTTSRPSISKLTLSNGSKMFSIGCVLIGLITFAVGVREPERIWPAYLTSFFFFASLSLGGLFFTAIQHISNAHWSVMVRRIPEAMASFLPVVFVAAGILVLFGGHHLYEWLNPDMVAADALLRKKTAYLNQNFFMIRVILFFAIWLFFGYSIITNSLKQDESGDHKLTLSNVKLSVAFVLLFALSYSLFSVDFLMSLDPHWYSTMFGVYCFAGLFQSTLAAILIFAFWARGQGLYKNYLTDAHIHDVGRFLFAFTVFYAYIAFSQFMLIWYGNIPEETDFFIQRGHGTWYCISLSLLVLKFLVPFLVLLPRGSKMNKKIAVPMAILILVMQYVDDYWLVYPNFNNGKVVFSYQEVGMFIGFAGMFVFVVQYFWSKYSIIPVKDPRIMESVHHHT